MNEMPAPVMRQVSKSNLSNSSNNTHPYEWLGDPSVDIKRKDEIVAGVFGASEVVVLHADTKVGKTQVATDLSFKIATGSEWFGRKVKRGKVLYLATEKGRVTKKRFKALQRMHQNIRPPIAISTALVNLTDQRQIDAIVAATREMADDLPVALIVVDTLNRSIAGIDENAAGPIGQIFNSLTRIAEETGAAILVLHHNGKNSKEMRGSTAIAACADVVISLKKLKDGLRIATIDHANDATEGQQFPFWLSIAEVWPATSQNEAESTVVIVPECNKDGAGAPVKCASRPSKADLDRADAVLLLVRTHSRGGRIDRTVLLKEARNQGVVNPDKLNSSSEQLRRALVANKEQGQLNYNNHEVWMTQMPNPNVPIPF